MLSVQQMLEMTPNELKPGRLLSTVGVLECRNERQLRGGYSDREEIAWYTDFQHVSVLKRRTSIVETGGKWKGPGPIVLTACLLRLAFHS